MAINIEEKMKQAYKMSDKANDLILEVWLTHVLFSWQWWLQLFLTIIPWVAWILLRKKDSTQRLLHAGFFVMIISSALDTYGVALGLWRYKWELIPFIPSYVPWDYTLIPIAVMISIQYNPFNLNRYTKAIIFAFLASFLVEPIFVKLGLYELIHWKHIYSFPIVVAIYLIADYLSRTTTFSRLE